MVSNSKRLTGGTVAIWTTLGLGTGLAAGIALSEWVGGVNTPRLQRAAGRLQQPAPVRAMAPAAGARAAGAALLGDKTLRGLGLEAVAIARGTVELRGWVPSRATRALAARVVRAVPGIESVVNSILVRGEDDIVSRGEHA